MKAPEAHIVRHPYERVRIRTRFVGESRTHQSHAEACDINNVVKRFEATGSLPPGREGGRYMDCTPLQGDITERWVESREVLDQAGREIEAQKEAEEKKRQEEQTDLEDQIRQKDEEIAALKQSESPVKE